MGKLIYVDDEMEHLLDLYRYKLKQEKKSDSYSNAIRFIAVSEPIETVRVKG